MLKTAAKVVKSLKFSVENREFFSERATFAYSLLIKNGEKYHLYTFDGFRAHGVQDLGVR